MATGDLLSRLLNTILQNERMPEEWRSVLVPISKNKGEKESCSNHRGTKLIIQ